MLFGRKKENRQRMQQLLALHGQAIRYVTERRDGNDDVVGRGGSLSVKDGEFLIFASADIIFRAKLSTVTSSMLLSGDGVVLTGNDLTRGGEERSVIAYFVYHRK